MMEETERKVHKINLADPLNKKVWEGIVVDAMAYGATLVKVVYLDSEEKEENAD